MTTQPKVNDSLPWSWTKSDETQTPVINHYWSTAKTYRIGRYVESRSTQLQYSWNKIRTKPEWEHRKRELQWMLPFHSLLKVWHVFVTLEPYFAPSPSPKQLIQLIMEHLPFFSSAELGFAASSRKATTLWCLDAFCGLSNPWKKFLWRQECA